MSAEVDDFVEDKCFNKVKEKYDLQAEKYLTASKRNVTSVEVKVSGADYDLCDY